jgi:hypothetical protein
MTNLYLRNEVHHMVALIAENALKLTYAYPYFKKFCMDETNYCHSPFPSQPSPWGKKFCMDKKPGSIKC